MQEVVCTHLVRRPAGVAIFRKTPAAAGGGKDKKRKDVSLFQSFFDLSQKKTHVLLFLQHRYLLSQQLPS